MLSADHGPSVVFPCRRCGNEVVWIRVAYGSWRLFDSSMQSIDLSYPGNRFAVDRRSRLAVDLDCVRESRWPAKCLSMHKFACPDSYDESKNYRRRPRQANDVDLTDLWRRLAASDDDGQTDSRFA
jgi:hypothetical protein